MTEKIYCSQCHNSVYTAISKVANREKRFGKDNICLYCKALGKYLPKIKPLDQRRVLFEQLPEEYETKTLIDEGRTQGISRATIMRWNEKWLEEGLVKKTQRGQYRKTA